MNKDNKHLDNLINVLIENKFIRSTKLEGAFRNVPRHMFVPNVSIEEAYQNKPISTKRNTKLGSISSASAPGLVAQMIELLDIKEGENILEIGAGTGFNAALIGYIVGEKGNVVTIDLDQDIVDKARENISKLGLKNIAVICRNGIHGDEAHAPYEKIILTVGAPDISSKLFNQLKEGGLLVIPLELSELESLYNNQPVIVFRKHKNHLVSEKIIRSGFMRMRSSIPINTSNLHTFGNKNEVWIYTEKQLNHDVVSSSLLQNPEVRLTNFDINTREVWALHLWFALRVDNYCCYSAKDSRIKLANVTRKDGPAQSSIGLCSNDTVSVLGLTINENRQVLSVNTFGKENNLTTEVEKQVYLWDKYERPFAYDTKGCMKGVTITAYFDKEVENNDIVIKKKSVELGVRFIDS